MPSSGASGSWSLDMRSRANPRTDTTYTSGVLNGERSVGVAVPWGLSDDSVRLEVRASNSLLPALAGIATDLRGTTTALATDGVSAAAARLSAPASVASAYERLNSTLPSGLAPSGVERSLLMQQIYSAQHSDGGWGYTLDGTGASSVGKTADVLLAFHRLSAYTGSSSALTPDPDVIDRAVAYLSREAGRPLPANPDAGALDERAFGFYVLSLYTSVSAEPVRALMVYAASNLGGQALSTDGQGWLALALWQIGNGADAVALLDHLLLTEQDSSGHVSAPLLDALVVGLQSLPAGMRSSDRPDYETFARRYAHDLMAARLGAGWDTPSATADAVWALSHYAAAEGEAPQGGATVPTLTLGDRQLQAATQPGNPGTLSVVLSGAELRPGTNWLKLKSSSTDQAVYYSLTLIATR
jgi:hypothetical protein